MSGAMVDITTAQPKPTAIRDRTPSPPREESLTIGHVKVPPRPVLDDDNQELSTTYKALGLVWQHGLKKRVTTKKFRCTLACACNSDEFPMLKVSQISEEAVDLLVFVLAGVSPNTKVCDLGCTTKGEARDACRSQYLVRMRKNPSRFDILAEELGNLPMVALRCGFDPNLFSPQTKAQYLEARDRMGAMHSG